MDDFNFYKISAAQRPGQMGDANGFLCFSGPGGVGQQGDSRRDIVQNILGAGGVGPPDRQGDDLRLRILDCRADEVQVIFTGSQNKAGGKLVPS